MAVSVTGGKIHFTVNVTRIFTQRFFNHAHRFDELAPVHRTQETETADAVAHGYLIGGLLLVLRPHELPDGEAALGQTLFNPGERQSQSRNLGPASGVSARQQMR